MDGRSHTGRDERDTTSPADALNTTNRKVALKSIDASAPAGCWPRAAVPMVAVRRRAKVKEKRWRLVVCMIETFRIFPDSPENAPQQIWAAPYTGGLWTI
jgi:hypothetical protein